MFGVSHTVDALLMTIIGGVGTFVGPVLGAGSLHIADVMLRDAEIIIDLGIVTVNVADDWPLIVGLIFVVVVMVFPFGIVGTFYRVRRWLTDRLRGTPATANTTMATTKQAPPSQTPSQEAGD